MRKFLINNSQVFERLTNVEYKLLDHNKKLYHCGASLKDLGKKCFAISKIEDEEYINKIVNQNY